MTIDPTTPYPEPDGTGTAGWSGSDASHDRALDEAEQGISAQRQRAILNLLTRRGHYGATWVEVAANRGWHHGQASGALSVLHRAGRVARLKERRNRSHVYVIPDLIAGRELSPYVDRAAKRAAEMEAVRQEGHDLGWQEGYERALAERGPNRADYEAGRREGAQAIVAHINAMLAAAPTSVAHHDDRCWHRHVGCALRAVRKAATQIGTEGPL